MLIVNTTYRIVDDMNNTVITIEKDGGIYRWKTRNADEDELGFTLSETNMSDVFKAIQDMTNFV